MTDDRAVVDPAAIDRLLDMTGGDPEFLRELITTYVEDGAAQLGAMRDAVSHGDAEALVRPAHSLKSNSASMGADHLAMLCRGLETDARVGRLDDAAERVAEASAEFELVRAALDALAAELMSAGGRVLVVDDERLNRTVLRAALTKQGHEVVEAVDGREALDRLAEGPIDVVLLDIVMPVMDGYATLAAIKADPDLGHIPVIIISGVDDIASVVRCIEMGATDYLPKPFQPAILQARLDSSLAAKRLRDLELEYLEQVSRVTGAAAALETGDADLGDLASVAARDDALGVLARRFESMAREVLAREAACASRCANCASRSTTLARPSRSPRSPKRTSSATSAAGRPTATDHPRRRADRDDPATHDPSRRVTTHGLTRYAPSLRSIWRRRWSARTAARRTVPGASSARNAPPRWHSPARPAAPSTSRARSSAANAPSRCRPAGRRQSTERPPSRRPPVSERRLVSILFADLVGFTTLAEGKDAEDTRELLSAYFDLSRDVIGRYGGTIEKFIGDAVMAVWGAPVAHEDDAERAVRAALDLVDEVRTLGPTIQARAGVLTGEAAVTLGATNQGMVAGDLVNTASRLQSAAAPGTVLVGEATHRAASNAIAFEEAGEQTLKGKTSPVPAWRALRVVAELGGRNRSETLEAPFVGRDDELRLLKDLFHATGRERRARLVSVIGPAGIGKSRLGWEFSKYTDGVVDTTYWHVGRSPAYGEGISFWALGEMVRRRAGLFETDDETTTRLKIAETLVEYVPDEADRRWIEPALLTLLGVETSAGGSEQLFAAWRTFFERIADQGTVAMVFEDFHYADSGLIDFVDHLLEWSRSVPIFVITLSRPELLERRADWGAGKRNFTSLYLEPLDPGAMRELLAGLVPGLPSLRRRGHRRPRGRHPAVCGRDGPDARRRGTPDHRRRHLSTGRRPDQPGGPGNADRAHRQPPRRPRSGRSDARLGRRRHRPELHAGRTRRRVRDRRGRARAATARARPP